MYILIFHKNKNDLNISRSARLSFCLSQNAIAEPVNAILATFLDTAFEVC